MSDGIAEGWLDAQEPHDAARSEAQIDGLLQLLGPAPRRVLDLGCGAGRTLIPIARRGHHVIGLDRSSAALSRCEAALGEHATARLIETDFRQPWPSPDAPFDMICCLGNTFMTLTEVDMAVEVLARGVASLEGDGLFVIDDFPHELWPQVADGLWQSGMSPDGAAQLVWAADDAVLALRTGAAVDPDLWHITESDTVVRLWTMGALRLAARCAGLSAPRRIADAGLLTMTPTTPDRPR